MTTHKPTKLSNDDIQQLWNIALAAKATNQDRPLLTQTANDLKGPPALVQNLAHRTRAEIVRAIIDIANGCGYHQSLKNNGISHLEMTAARHQDRELAVILSAAERIAADDLARTAKESLQRLATEEGCELNVKAATFLAERLDRETFGQRSEDGGGQGGAKVVYNIVINAGSGAQPCGNFATTEGSKDFLEADSND